jgi:hypothetical protein
MFVLFDSCFGDEPSLEKANSPTWLNNPGFSRIGKDHWPDLEEYVRAVVEPYRNDARVLMWDVMNEPMADFAHVTRPEREAIWAFCRHFCGYVRQIDPDKPITVGHAVVEYIPKTIDLVDVASVHSYAPFPDWLDADLDLACKYAEALGKPVIVTEFGNPGAGQSYEMALDVIQSRNMGFYFWELMIGKMQFKEEAGLIYPDGSIREPSAVAHLLGFPVRTRGGIPLKPAPDLSALRELLEAPEQWPGLLQQVHKLPRERKNVLAVVHSLAAVGRRAARPSEDAQQIFESALSIPHLFASGKEKAAWTQYDRLLQLVDDAVRQYLEREAAKQRDE